MKTDLGSHQAGALADSWLLWSLNTRCSVHAVCSAVCDWGVPVRWMKYLTRSSQTGCTLKCPASVNCQTHTYIHPRHTPSCKHALTTTCLWLIYIQTQTLTLTNIKRQQRNLNLWMFFSQHIIYLFPRAHLCYVHKHTHTQRWVLKLNPWLSRNKATTLSNHWNAWNVFLLDPIIYCCCCLV